MGDTVPAETIDTNGQVDFDMANLQKYFESCLREDGSLDMDQYIKGYDEIYKFLNLLGTVFGWVASDVHAKLEILRSHRKGDSGAHYETIQTMVAHELKEKMIQPKAKESGTGSRNLLRLHRALDYINTFLEKLPALDSQEKCCPPSQNAYKKTLAKYHPWVVQKAATLAMNMLPTKEGLIHKICGDSEEEYKEAQRVLPLAVAAMQRVYEKTQEVYQENKILDLP